MLRSHDININKTAKYYTLGKLSDEIKTVWFVFHGYGQLAKEFINEFLVLENKATLIIAPEALNKFYLRGFSGKIGTTWMTKDNRENEIIDYSNFIESIFKKELNNIDINKIKINVLGFSQGAHTCVRWLDRFNHKINNLFLWGASFPHDCNYNNSYWESIKAQIIFGKDDRFLTKEIIEKEKKYLISQNIKFSFLNFEGKHEISKEVLLKLN